MCIDWNNIVDSFSCKTPKIVIGNQMSLYTLTMQNMF